MDFSLKHLFLPQNAQNSGVAFRQDAHHKNEDKGFKLIFLCSYFLSSKEPKDSDQLYSTLKTILQQVKVSASSSLPSVKISKYFPIWSFHIRYLTFFFTKEPSKRLALHGTCEENRSSWIL